MAYDPTVLLAQTQFTQPDGFSFDLHKAQSGRNIRHGFLKTPQAMATIVIFPGMSEFIEKYFELSRELQSWGYNVFIFDWPNQGLSTRYLSETMRRHSLGFDTELVDIYEMLQHVLPKNQPLYMLGHSMGGHMALRYFESYIDPRFQKLAVSAPMLDINIQPAILKAIAPTLARFFVLIGMGSSYVLGGRDWDFNFHSKNAEMLSHDEPRNMLHRAWYLRNIKLQLGSATFAWLNEAFLSCEHLADPAHLKNIDVPVLMITAGNDTIVDNKTVPHFIEHISTIEHLNIADSYHEIFMESDTYRDIALNRLKEFFTSS
ncbi:MAG: hypothetical protein CMH30_06925 [Micavibrio sp.]|nr:hypothetical protein [Micavibrio sp.]|tara:strand:+ start:416 stop:1366 length:951 start_codon:yes stop_codon:yes gene_type:complete